MEQFTSQRVIGVLDWEIGFVDSTAAIRSGRTLLKPADIEVREWNEIPEGPPKHWMQTFFRTFGSSLENVSYKTVRIDRDFSLMLSSEAKQHEDEVKWIKLDVDRGAASRRGGKMFLIDRAGHARNPPAEE